MNAVLQKPRAKTSASGSSDAPRKRGRNFALRTSLFDLRRRRRRSFGLRPSHFALRPRRRRSFALRTSPFDLPRSGNADGVSDVENPYTFTARRWDAESGLMQYRNRYYDPALGRFVSRDPSCQDFPNLYEYAKGRAALASDPYGLTMAPILIGPTDWGHVATGGGNPYGLPPGYVLVNPPIKTWTNCGHLGRRHRQMVREAIMDACSEVRKALPKLQRVQSDDGLSLKCCFDEQFRNTVQARVLASADLGALAKILKGARKVCRRGVDIKCHKSGNDGRPARTKGFLPGSFWDLHLYPAYFNLPEKASVNMLHELTHYGNSDDGESGIHWRNAHWLEELIPWMNRRWSCPS